MLEIKNIKVYGLEESVKRSGYPMRYGEPEDTINDKDYKRAKSLGKTKPASGHDNFLKGIIVQFDLKYSLYFTKQMERYHFIDFISSQSTMHTITKRGCINEYVNKYVSQRVIEIINYYIALYNKFENDDKDLWNDIDKVWENRYTIFMRIISNLPSGFEIWAGMTTNYLQLKNIYFQRKNHKLIEDWGYFCECIENLPMFKEMILGE